MNAFALAELDSLSPEQADFAVRVVDLLLQAGRDNGASDLHIQPRSDGWGISFRIDGVLSPWIAIRKSENSMVTRLMVLGDLPTYRSGQPMEGRLHWNLNASDDQEHVSADETPAMRLSVFPTIHGPRAVVRFLRRDHGFETIGSLGLPDDVANALHNTSEQMDGAVLLSGPAGSGKTTTLYAVLRKIAGEDPRRSVLTIEDPVESFIANISQSELDATGGMTLAAALRSAVRQDSQVLLVSEIRDPETAEAAFQASLTGHLVYSSIHASDVAGSLRRLTQLGVPTHAIRSGLRAIVSQRLLRRTCSHCGGSQCDQCGQSGYHGRIVVAHCVRFDGSDPVGEAMADAIEGGLSLAAIRKAEQDTGEITLRQRAQAMADSGQTTQDEVYRIFGKDNSES